MCGLFSREVIRSESETTRLASGVGLFLHQQTTKKQSNPGVSPLLNVPALLDTICHVLSPSPDTASVSLDFLAP